MTCPHIWTLYRTPPRPPYLACLLCAELKPPEPCYFTQAGEQDRKAMEAQADA